MFQMFEIVEIVADKEEISEREGERERERESLWYPINELTIRRNYTIGNIFTVFLLTFSRSDFAPLAASV